MDVRPVEGAEKEEGAEWIDTSDPMPEAIVPGTPGAPKELGPVVAEEFCAEKPMQFFARRKSFSWGEADWSFSDNAGNLEFEVTGGKFGYVSVKRFLTDAYGNQVLQMQNKVITLFPSIAMNECLQCTYFCFCFVLVINWRMDGIINLAINLLTLIVIPSWKCAALDIEVEVDGVRHRK